MTTIVPPPHSSGAEESARAAIATAGLMFLGGLVALLLAIIRGTP